MCSKCYAVMSPLITPPTPATIYYLCSTINNHYFIKSVIKVQIKEYKLSLDITKILHYVNSSNVLN